MDTKMEYDDINDDDIWDDYTYHTGVTFPEKDLAEYIYTYVPPFFLFIGTFGNITSAIILHKIYSRVLSTCLYLFVIVIVDLIVLYILCGNVWIQHLANINIKEEAVLYNNSLCKIYPFLSDFTLHLTTWMAVAMALETTLVTMQPPRLLRMCNLERARAVILLLVVLLVCLNAHCFWSFALVKVEKTTMKSEVCTTAKPGNHNNEEFRKIVWPILDILIADLLPYCIIFSCAVILITKRLKRKEQVRELETVWKSFSVESDSAKQFHSSILTICLFYIILLLAKMGNNIFHFLVDTDGLALVKYSLVLESRKIFADAICSVLLYLFLSCKFFMLLASSARFRQEFVGLLTCQSCCRPSLDPSTRRPTTKSSQQPLLLPVNNHNSTKCEQMGGVQQHVLTPESQPDQTTVSLCLQPAPPPPPPIMDNPNNLSPRKQIYSMTSV